MDFRANDRVRSVDNDELGTILYFHGANYERCYVKWDTTNTSSGIHVSKLKSVDAEKDTHRKSNGTYRRPTIFDNLVIDE